MYTFQFVTVLLPSATKLRRLCFYTCLSLSTGGVCLSACRDATPWEQALPGTRHPPRNQAPAPARDQAPPEQTATVADGTHPTGMHSCYLIRFVKAAEVGGRAYMVGRDRTADDNVLRMNIQVLQLCTCLKRPDYIFFCEKNTRQKTCQINESPVCERRRFSRKSMIKFKTIQFD